MVCYSFNVTVMGSREQLCIHPQVMNEDSNAAKVGLFYFVFMFDIKLWQVHISSLNHKEKYIFPQRCPFRFQTAHF